MSADKQEFKFDSVVGGSASWKLETNLSSEEVNVIIEEVRQLVSEVPLQFDEIRSLVTKVANDNIQLSHRPNYCRHLGYSPEGHNVYGRDIAIDVYYPVINSDVNPRTKMIARKIAEAIFKTIDDLGVRDKIIDSKGF